MKKIAFSLGLSCAFACALLTAAPQAPDDGPALINGTDMTRPYYAEWIFLASGLGMTYNDPPAGDAAARTPRFSNIFVNPSAYKQFMRTGTWPDKTVLILEIRASASEASINKSGFFQTNRAGLEAHVKDSRLPGGWAFYNFRDQDVASPMTGEAVRGCNECHADHGAVDNTFVQFYPTLLEAARLRGTLKPGF